MYNMPKIPIKDQIGKAPCFTVYHSLYLNNAIQISTSTCEPFHMA